MLDPEFRSVKPPADPSPPSPRGSSREPRPLLPVLATLGLVFGVSATQTELGWWWAMVVLFGPLVLLFLGALVLGVRDGIREEREEALDAEPLLFDPPLRGGHPWSERQPRLLLQLVGDALVLILCARLVSGIDMDAVGFAIAMAVISIPMIGITEHLDRPREWHTFQRETVLWLLSFLVAPIWVVASPALADQITSRFNIHGYVHYLLLVAGLYFVSPTASRVVFAIRYGFRRGD